MDINEYISSDDDVIALLELQQLYQGDVFACYYRERKLLQHMTVHFLPHKSQICFKPISSMNTANATSDDHNANGGFMILDLPNLKVSSLQL